jgi:imidazolonepropionase-like amidohydrolase
LTNGIIDEHSHIAIDGDVNEGTQSVTAEVNIGSVINPTDIQIYRQLAGGVTTSQLLHGSANAIGGQSAIVKLRWGQPADSFTIQDAKGFIKFALGENVKQSNWGDQFKTRYPQTRLGVEQIIRDAFIRAKEYKNTQESYLRLKKTQLSALAPPRDLQSEAILEILEGKRFITCHSYEQGEINMLIKLGDSLGFKVNTFTHGLEAYKVADKILEKGINVSSFSDWWAYKYEVMEAIPQNPALLSKMGVTVAVNSDDAEMGRRLNQEAAKSVKYGHLSESEAWKLVTLNPAKMLHLDHRLGTIESGKDADLVLWSSNPLSIQARVLKTWVDGRNLYDSVVSDQMYKQQEIEKRTLFKKMLVAAEHEPSVPVQAKPQTLHICETNHP